MRTQSSVSSKVGSSTDIGITNGTPIVPADDAIPYVANGTGGVSSTSQSDVGNFYILEANNVIVTWKVVKTTHQDTNSTFNQVSYSNSRVGPTQCVYNHVQGHLYHIAAANSDVAAVETALTSLQAIDNFRDPVTTGKANTTHGITDSDFQANVESHATNGPNGTLTVLRDTIQPKFRSAFNASSRVTHPTGNPAATSSPHTATGDAVSYSSFSHGGSTYNGVTAWSNFVTAWGTNLKGAIIARIAEIDARIGTPTRSTAAPASGRENPPTVTVSAIPASNTTGGFVPYGRSIYNGCNLLLGQDVNLLGGIIKDIESLTDLIDMVKNDRNKYEIYSGRDKKY